MIVERRYRIKASEVMKRSTHLIPEGTAYFVPDDVYLDVVEEWEDGKPKTARIEYDPKDLKRIGVVANIDESA